MQKILLFVSILFSYCFVQGQTFSGTGGGIPGTSITQTCFTINITDVGNINTTTNGLAGVCFTITHPNLEELEVLLTAPDGTVVPLTIQNGGSGNNYTNTCFSATAASSVKFATAPFTGTFLPEGYLGAVNNGQNANGAWKLCIQDRRTGSNAGTLNNWRILFNNTPAPLPPLLQPAPLHCPPHLPALPLLWCVILMDYVVVHQEVLYKIGLVPGSMVLVSDFKIIPLLNLLPQLLRLPLLCGYPPIPVDL